MQEEPGFLREFVSRNNNKVDSATVLASLITLILAALSIPASILGMFAVYQHVWVLKKGLDSSVVSLILGLAGAGGFGMGVGYAAVRLGRGGLTRAKPAPLQGE